jgi:hypothetical protein
MLLNSPLVVFEVIELLLAATVVAGRANDVPIELKLFAITPNRDVLLAIEDLTACFSLSFAAGDIAAVAAAVVAALPIVESKAGSIY